MHRISDASGGDGGTGEDWAPDRAAYPTHRARSAGEGEHMRARGPHLRTRTLPGSQNVTLCNGNMERNGSAPKINPGDFEKQQWLCPGDIEKQLDGALRTLIALAGDLEKQLFGALRTVIAWAPRAGAGRKGWGPYRAPLPGPRHLPDLVVHLLLVVAVVVIIMGCPVESPRQQSQVV